MHWRVTVRLSKHAKEKSQIRQIDPRTIEDVLSSPAQRFYDTLRGSEVAAKAVKLDEGVSTLAVIYARRDDERYVITVYPSRRFKAEADRKVKSGRWVRIT